MADERRTVLEHALDHGDAAAEIADTAGALLDLRARCGAHDGELRVAFTTDGDAREAHRLLTRLQQQLAAYRARFGARA